MKNFIRIDAEDQDDNGSSNHDEGQSGNDDEGQSESHGGDDVQGHE